MPVLSFLLIPPVEIRRAISIVLLRRCTSRVVWTFVGLRRQQNGRGHQAGLGFSSWKAFVTVLVPVTSFFMVYDFPDSSMFLSTGDRLRVYDRLKADHQARAEHEAFKWAYFSGERPGLENLHSQRYSHGLRRQTLCLQPVLPQE